jgi:hypothetical protein
MRVQDDPRTLAPRNAGLVAVENNVAAAVSTLIIGGATAETSKEQIRNCVDGISAVHKGRGRRRRWYR